MTEPTPSPIASPAPDIPGGLALDVRSRALFLDFDGTLTALQDNPDLVTLPEGGVAVLTRLSRAMDGALAIVSGRDIRDLDRRIPGDLWRVGGHGADVCAPGQQPCAYSRAVPDALYHAVFQSVDAIEGAWLERKGPILAVHFRKAPEAGERLGGEMSAILADHPGYSLQRGKMILEIKPHGTTKARAVARLMALPPFTGRKPVMVGDDATDEDGMREALDRGGSAVKVGDADTLAPHRLADPDAVWAWLETLIP